MSLKKQYLRTKPVCKVTFRVPAQAAGEAKTVHLLGEFNRWSPKATPMQKLKDGSFKKTIDLKTGQEYQFRYLLNQSIWVNDGQADKYIPSPFGDAENSIVIV